MISTSLRARVVAPVFALVLAACGGGGGSDEGDAGDGSGPLPTSAETDDSTDDTDFTLPPIPDAEFEDYSDGKIRFANFWRVGEEGSPVDVYWGTNAESGEKVATVEYGTVSDWYPMKIESNPLFDDEETRLRAVIQRPGDTSIDGFLQTLDETLDGGDQWTVIMGWSDTFNPDRPDSMSTQLVYEEEVGTAPAGQALLLLNTVGAQGIEGGDFLSLDAVGTCNQEWPIDNDIAIGNGGTAYPVPVGAVEFVAHDANVSDCAEAAPTDPISLDLADGDRYLVLVWGTSRDDRSAAAVPIEG